MNTALTVAFAVPLVILLWLGIATIVFAVLDDATNGKASRWLERMFEDD
jgi:hypothetical protein